MIHRWFMMPLALATAGLIAAALETQSQHAGIVATLPALDGSAFNTIDVAVNKEGEIPTTALGTVNRAIAAVDGPYWPQALWKMDGQ